MIQRNVAGNDRLSIIGAPLNGLTIGVLDTRLVFGYDNSTASFSSPASGTSMIPGVGYFIGKDVSSYQLSLIGTLQSGQVDVAVTDNSAASGDAFNLIANPYAAAIDADAFFANANNTANTTGVIYLWDDGGSNVGGNRGGDYITVNSAGSVGTTNPGNGVGGVKGSARFDDHVLSAQGFFVEATQNGNVSFTTDMMVAGKNSDANFFREDIVEKVKLSLSNEDGLYNETLVALTGNATEGVDYSLDARKLSGNSDIAFYSWIEAEQYAIQSVPLEGEVVLGFDVRNAGVYTLKVEELSTAQGATFYLTDYVTAQVYDLGVVDEIQLNLEESTDTRRFLLSQKPSVVSVTTEELTSGLSILRGDESGVTISFPETEAEVQLQTLAGQTLLQGHYQFSDGAVTLKARLSYNQVYLLHVGDDTVKFTIKE